MRSLAALDVLGARRIAHGIRAVEDPALVARLTAEGVVLDICPTSNIALGVVESLSVHPLPLLLRAGVRCTLNADDPLLFGPGLLEEYETARTAFALTDPQLAAIARTSLESSGAPRATVEDAVTLIGDWLSTPDTAGRRRGAAKLKDVRVTRPGPGGWPRWCGRAGHRCRPDGR